MVSAATDEHEPAGKKSVLGRGESMEAGPQPLDELMNRHAIANHDLVELSELHLTHKEVQKGRKGRRLTGRTQRRLLAALQAKLPDETLTVSDLFTYRGR